ncbi:MAG: HAD family hydrolase [Bacillota bacterium]|nr:HAD family hydrolase [Bacillota bacterium]
MHRNIILDLDETMVESQKAFEALHRDLVPKYFPGVDVEHFRTTMRTCCMAVMNEFEPQYFMTYGLGSLDFYFEPELERYLPDGLAERTKRRMFDETLAALKLTASDETYRGFVEELSRVWVRYFRTIEGTEEMLRAFRQRGLRLFMLTDGFHNVQMARIVQCKLAQYFDRVYVSEDLGVGKRSPEAFRRLMEREGLDPAETVMVGDNARHDYESAEKTGILSLLFDRYDRYVGVYPRRIRVLSEVLDWLEAGA